MRPTIVASTVVACISSSTLSTWAFDPQTHAAMSSEAVAQSRFSRNALPSELGRRLGANSSMLSLGEEYVDLGAPLRIRKLIDQEREKLIEVRDLSGLIVAGPDTISGWMMRGSMREDDNSVETPWSEEPGGVFNRVFGHFFDPQNNRGLTGPLGTLGPRALDWALTKDAAVFPILGGPGRTNNYKISDSREAMWRALTLKTPDGNGGFNDSVEPSGWSGGKEKLRKAYWGTTFRALGDVIHLLQDMAQPQHTRNDLHSGFGCFPGGGCIAGHDSFVEKYLLARTLRQGSFTLKESVVHPIPPHTVITLRTTRPPLVYEGYSKPLFNSYRDFFATDGNLMEGRGLAQYSSRGFYSFGTNIRTSGTSLYPQPSPTGQGLGMPVVSGPALKDMTGETIPGSITFRTGSVPDIPGFTENDVKLSSFGVWDQFLQERGLGPSYTLNYYNYDEQARLLVPRAVAYSAGLIDYFFRGKLTISLPDDGVYALVDHATFSGEGAPTTDKLGFKGFGKIKLKLSNSTPDIATPDGTVYPQPMGAGTLMAVMKFHRDNCYNDQLTGESGVGCRSLEEEIVVSQPQSVTSVSTTATEKEFTFEQHLPINATDAYLQVVFRGVLGSENDAVAVGTVDLAEPTYHGFVNAKDTIAFKNTAPIGFDNKVYTREQVVSRADLLTLVQPRSCIDGDGKLRGSCLLASAMATVIAFKRPPMDGESTLPGDGKPQVPLGRVVRVTELPSKRFYRIAYLTNAGLSQPVFTETDCYAGRDETIDPFSAQVDLDAAGFPVPNFQPLKKVRGAYSWAQRHCVLPGDGQPLGILDESGVPDVDLKPVSID